MKLVITATVKVERDLAGSDLSLEEEKQSLIEECFDSCVGQSHSSYTITLEE